MNRVFRRSPTLSERAYLLAGIAVAFAVPAAVIAIRCDGCVEESRKQNATGFCSSPAAIRDQIARGYREGRSADVQTISHLEVAGVPTATAQQPVTWPSTDPVHVSVAMWGHGIPATGDLPELRLDAIAPTLEDVLGLDRPHPEVRSGRPLTQVVRSGTAPPRLVVVIGWKKTDHRPSAALSHRIAAGTGTTLADPGSLPLDPGALFATIGTGGLPDQHGITGTLLRNEHGRVVEAFGKGSPSAVIAALADDLDEMGDGRPLIGSVGQTPADRGLIGKDWYGREDGDDVILLDPAASPGAQRRAATELLSTGYGRDGMPDLLGLALTSSSAALERHLPVLERKAARDSGGRVTFVLVEVRTGRGLDGGSVIRRITSPDGGRGPVTAVGAGAVFLDQAHLTRTGGSTESVSEALRQASVPSGENIFSDVFPSSTIAFAEYC